MSSSYVCEMRYEASAKPVLARVVKLDRSRALTADEADFTVLVAEANTDIVVDLPEQAEEKRGFRVVNLGKGKLTLRAPLNAKVAGLDSIEIGPGEQMEGAAKSVAEQPLGELGR